MDKIQLTASTTVCCTTPHQPYLEQPGDCPWLTVLLPMQVYAVLPPQESSRLDFKVDAGELNEVLDAVDTNIEGLDVLDEDSKV